MSNTRSTTQTRSMIPFAGLQDFDRPWDEVDVLTLPCAPSDRYQAGFAHSTRCVEDALRLRYEVFNVELEEGLAESIQTGLDRDAYDDRMTHLVLLERETHRIVGTYRMQAGGEAFVSNAVIEGRYALRGCVVNFRTTQQDIEAIADLTVRLGREVLAEWSI